MECRYFVYGHHNGKVASVVCIRCETDFCANTSEFKTFGNHVAMLIAGSGLSAGGDLKEVVGEDFDAIRKTLGEDIWISEWSYFDTDEGGLPVMHRQREHR